MPRSSSIRPLRTALAVCASAAALAGCATVGPNFKSPAAPATDTYAQTGDAADVGPVQTAVGAKVVADWWTLFHSPQLDALVREAIANNPTLDQARARLQSAREAVQAQTGLAMADVSGGYKYERANLNAFSGGAFSSSTSTGGISFPTNPVYSLYSIGGTVSYNLDLFGQVRRRKEALQADAEAKARELDAAYLTLTGQVVTQVLTIADASIQANALKDIVANDQTDLDMVRKARAAGGASASDVSTIETELAEDAAAVPAQEQRLAAARHQIAILLGKTPSQFSPPDFDASSGAMPDMLPVSLPSELVRGRPDILEAEAQLHAATARIGVATAALYPNITLSAALNQDALTPSQMFQPISNSWALGPAVTAPIFHSGELHAEKRQAEADARAALAAYQQTVLAAFAQVDDALQAIAHDNAAYAQQSRALEAATSKLEMMRRGYRAGGVSSLQLVDAERSWRRTRLALSQQGTGRYGDAARLLMATATVPPGVAEAKPVKPAP
ncbi:MAG: efflux transporter outer membrane subunit [Caulobacteraceae bacterium]|nr:efflux transporter outer membrane subunit [Caulobacteraceae bacterium]